MCFKNRLALNSAKKLSAWGFYVFLTMTLTSVAFVAANAQGERTANRQANSQTVSTEDQKAEENRPVQIMINSPAARVRALIVAAAVQKDSNTIEDAGEYKIVIKRPSDEGDYGHTSGKYITTTVISTFIIAEVEKGKTLVRLDVALVINGAPSGPYRFDTGKSKLQRARSEKILQDLKALCEQSEQSANPPVQP